LGSGGIEYKWVKNPDSFPVPPLPDLFLKRLRYYDVPLSSKGDITLAQGTRNENLFTLVWAMAKGGIQDERALTAAAVSLARSCTPPLSEVEAGNVVRSVLTRLRRTGRNYSEDIRLWVSATSGEFELPQLYRELAISDVNSQANARQTLQRLVEEGVLVNSSKKYGRYRRVERNCDPIDFANATATPLELSLPFDLHEWVNIYPGNIIIVAGEQDAGKTAALIDFIKRNQELYEIYYFSNEMGDSELHLRLSLHEDMKMGDWKFTARERSMNFADVIVPGKVNIIDYIQVNDSFWLISKDLDEIWQRLAGGLAIIALQKGAGQELGRGGSFSLEKPRLYLTLSRSPDYIGGIAKIIKAKNWKTACNPNGRTMRYKIVNGARFIYSGTWEHETPEAKPSGFRRLY
jgi:hypothetical protein